MIALWIKDLFANVMNQSISASWLILAVIFVRICMKKAPKSLRYVLWALVAVRLLCPFSIESAWSLVPEIESFSQEKDEYVDSIVLQENASAQQESFEQLDGNAQYFEVSNQMESDKNVEILPEENVDITDRPTNRESFSIEAILPVASWIWFLGMLVIGSYSVISMLRLKKKVEASLHIEKNVWICDEIQSPFILGMSSPRIYVPSFASETELSCILAHENEHLKYRDHWWKPFGFMILTLHWFNPLVWVAYILLCRDIELACDERVIMHMNEEEKKQYSKSLLLCNNPRYLISACPVAFGEVGVKARIKSILDYKKPSTWVVGIGVLVCIILVVCFMTNPKNSEGEGVLNTEDSTESESGIANRPVASEDETLKKYVGTQMGEPLSEAELKWFETEFFNTEENRMPNMFLTSIYDTPENINLNNLFYCGADVFGGGEITEEEKELLQQTYYPEGELELDVSRTTTDEMNAILQKYMNLSLEDTNKLYLENLHYLPECDAYYKVAGDTEYALYMIMAGWKNADETITLMYHPINQSVTHYYQVTLEQDGDNYYFLSNLALPIDLSVITAKEITEEEVLSATSDVDGQTYTSMLNKQNGYTLCCSSPASGLMTKVLCKTSDGGNTFEEYLDISEMPNYPCDIYFFTEDIGYIITDYHCSDSFLYRTEDGGKTWSPQAVYIPGSGYRYVNGLSVEDGILYIEVVLDELAFYYSYTTDDMGETWQVISSSRMHRLDGDLIQYNGRIYKKSELSDATLQWLEMTEMERSLSSYFPPEFAVFAEKWGITLTATNITPTGLTLQCTQSGGRPTGELQTGSWYVLETWTQEHGWQKVPCYAEAMWTQEAWIIPMNDTCEWEVNWEWLYGQLPEGKYQIGKEITDFRGTGDYDATIYFAEFEITEE